MILIFKEQGKDFYKYKNKKHNYNINIVSIS